MAGCVQSGCVRQTPLHLAAGAESARVLLERGAALDAVDRLGNTPLHLAARHQRLHALAALLEWGPDFSLLDRKNLEGEPQRVCWAAGPDQFEGERGGMMEGRKEPGSGSRGKRCRILVNKLVLLCRRCIWRLLGGKDVVCCLTRQCMSAAATGTGCVTNQGVT